jgi:hypothetical protein
VDGTSRTIQWRRTGDKLQYFESDGTTPLTVAQGKTYICLTGDHLKSRTTVK